MRELNCKLIVSDFDGTLANSSNIVDEKNILAINSYEARGGIFAVCTGRMLPAILPRIREIGLEGLVVACQGSVIADVRSGKLIRNVAFTREQTVEICSALEELGVNIQMYSLNGYYTTLPADEKHLNLYESIIGIKARHADIPLSEVAKSSDEQFNKFAILCGESVIKELYYKLNGMFGDKYDVTCSASVLIEISPFGETKGAALKFLASHYGIPMERTCAIGDNLNDLSMLKAAGVGVAVGNGSEELKKYADYVTVTNDEGAVAKVINDFGFVKNV